MTEVTWDNLFRTVEGLVAVGAIALAFVTGALALATLWVARKTASLAKSTRQEVSALGDQLELSQRTVEVMQEQVEVARTEVEASRANVESTIRPVLVDVRRPTDPDEVEGGSAQRFDEVGWQGTTERRRIPVADAFAWEDDSGIYLSVPLRNVGPGTALMRGIGIRFARDLPGGGFPTMSVIPPGESTRIQFVVPRYEGQDASPSLTELMERGGYAMDVAYTDVAGGQWTMTRAHVGRDSRSGRWYVAQIHLFHKVGEGEGSIDWGEPVAASTGSWGCRAPLDNAVWPRETDRK